MKSLPTGDRVADYPPSAFMDMKAYMQPMFEREADTLDAARRYRAVALWSPERTGDARHHE